MRHPGQGRQWQGPDGVRRQRGRRGWEGGPWEWGGRGGPGSRGGQPPWMAGLFGLAPQPGGRGPRARRGDVRAAILDVLTGEPKNGYQIITEIAERTGGLWKASPGSVYPTLQQLEDEGLVEAAEGGRKASMLTDAGREYVATNAEELAAVWRPFADAEEEPSDFAAVKPEVGQVLNALWQIVTTGSEHQRREAVTVLVETRKRLYGILAEGDPEQSEE